MAETTDLQRLVVSMEARYASMERELRKANGVANKQARAIETRFQKMNTSVGASLGRVGGLLAGAFSIRAAQQLIDASTRIQNSLKIAGLSGDELTRVYERLFQSAQKNAVPLESMVELYGRVALVQNELGITSAELENFTDKIGVALRVSGKSAAESSGALLQLSQALGSGVVRAEEFSSMLEGALPIVQAAAAGLEEAGGSVAKLRQLVIDGKISSVAFFRAFEAGAPILEQKLAGAELTVSQGFVRLQNVMIDAAGRLNDVSGASRAASTALGLLARGIELVTDKRSLFMQAVDGYAEGVGGLGASLNRLLADPSWDNFIDFTFRGSPDTPAQQRTENIAAATAALRDRLKEVAVEAETASGAVMKMTPGLDARFGDAFAAVKPVSITDYAAPTASKSGSGKSDAATAADKIADVRKELAFEAEQLTRTAREQEIYNRLKAAGVTATSAEGRTIAEATGKLYDQQQALERSIGAMDGLRDSAKDLAEALVDGFLDGKSASESFGDALEDLGKRILSSGLDSIIASIFGAGGTAGAGPFAAIASALFGGARANGGPVSAGKAYLVGERGPELMVPRVAGAVIPNGQLGRGGGGIAVHYAPQITIQGNADDRSIRAMRDGMLRDLEARLPGMIGKARGSRKLN